jgi:hypothetical protein
VVLAVSGAGPAKAATKAARGVDSLTLGSPGVPFGFVEPLNPLVTLGDVGDQQLAFVTPLATVPADALAKTTWLDLGQPGVDKEFLSLIWNADSDRAATYIVSYSVNGAAWLPAVGRGSFEIPDGTHGKTIAVRVWMTTSDVNATPRIDDITIEWTKWKGKPTKPGGDGSGVSHKPNAGHNSGSGVYTYPSADKAPAPAPPAQGTGGTGSGSGSSGVAPGSTGSGSGVAPAVADAAPETVAPAPASEVPAPPVMSTGEGDQTAVTGVLSDQGQQVSGVPYVPAGEVGAADAGGTPPGGAKGGLNVPVLLVTTVAAVLGIVLFVPWLVTAASLRNLTGFSESRARAQGPFGPRGRRTRLF